MAKRTIRLEEQDVRIVFQESMILSGLMRDGERVLGVEYKTKKIKKGGDYYKDGVTDSKYPGEVEEVKWVKVLVESD